MTSQEPQVLQCPTALEIRECEELLGTGKTAYNIPHLLSCYELKLWAMEENKEWSTESFNKFTEAKFVLLRQLVLEQIKTNGRFSVTTKFDNPCNKCGGSGEIYKFLRKSQKVKCMKCVEGKLPEGAKCPTCKGNGTVKTFGIVPTLRDTTTCTYCKGKGYFKEKKIDNPALDIEAAQALKKKISSTVVEPETNLGAEVKAATVPDQVAPHIVDPTQDTVIGEGTLQKKKQPPAD